MTDDNPYKSPEHASRKRKNRKSISATAVAFCGGVSLLLLAEPLIVVSHHPGFSFLEIPASLMSASGFVLTVGSILAYLVRKS